MPLSKRTEEEFDKKFDSSSFCGCYEGDLNDIWPDGRGEVLNFIHQAQVDAIKEFVEGLVPEKKKYTKKDIDVNWENKNEVREWDEIFWYNKAIDEIQERINKKLKEI